MVTIAELDAVVDQLTAAERAVSANLVELEDQPTYKLLAPATLRGITAHRVGPALAAFAELWQQFSLLRELLARARELRGDDKDLPAFRRKELYELLTGPSIALAVNQVPLEERGLLGPAQTTNTISPQALLDSMTRTFDAARDAVFAVDTVWRETLPRLDRASQRAAALDETAKAVGVADLAELAGLRSRIAALQAAVAEDPLGVQAGFDAEVGPALAAAEAAVGALAHQHATLGADFERAQRETDELAELIAGGAAALAEARAKIAGPQGLLQPLGAELIDAERDGLRPWLARLGAIRDRGDWRVARRGLDQFLRTSAARLDVARAVSRANRAPLERRDELRGLLDAYRVKASARGQSEDEAQAARYRAARDALFTTPTDLARAEALVAAYGHATTPARYEPQPERG